MAILVKTVKHKAFKEGKVTFKRYFEELEQYGVEAKAIRKFNNEDSRGSFYTVEITRANLLRILGNLNKVRDNEFETQVELDPVQNNNYMLDMSAIELKKEITHLKNIIRSQDEALKKVQQIVNITIYRNIDNG